MEYEKNIEGRGRDESRPSLTSVTIEYARVKQSETEDYKSESTGDVDASERKPKRRGPAELKKKKKNSEI